MFQSKGRNDLREKIIARVTQEGLVSNETLPEWLYFIPHSNINLAEAPLLIFLDREFYRDFPIINNLANDGLRSTLMTGFR